MHTQETYQIIKNSKNLAMEFVANVRRWLEKDPKNAVVLYGAGGHLLWVLRFMKRFCVPVAAIVDSNKSGEYLGIPILRYDRFVADYTGKTDNLWFVISAPSAEQELRVRLSADFPNAEITCCEMQLYVEFIPDIEQYRAYLTEHWEDFIRFSNDLQDDASKATLASVLEGRITGNLSCFRSCFVPDQYYVEGIIRLSPDEIMVELGSYDGESMRRFAEHCPQYRAAYCFEPEKALLPGLREIQRAQAAVGNRMILIPKGAWDHPGELTFFSNDLNHDSGSFLMDHTGTNQSIIEVTTVDEAVPERITFLKMDVEGAELRALHGAANHIRADKPKLAICVYHKAEDMLDIWNYLKQLVPEYRFYLRHHNQNAGTETVLYCLWEA